MAASLQHLLDAKDKKELDVKIIDIKIGHIRMHHTGNGVWNYKSSSSPSQPCVKNSTSSSNRKMDLNKECGRTDTSMENAKNSAVDAENRDTILTCVGQDKILTDAGPAANIATKIGDQVHCSNSTDQKPSNDSTVVIGRGRSKMRTSAALAYLHKPVLTRLKAALDYQAKSQSTAQECNQLLRQTLRAGHPVLTSDDFAPKRVPNVGYIYYVMLSVPASEWLRAWDAFVIRGEGPSWMTGETASLGFRVVLNQIGRTAKELVDARKGEEMLSTFYIAQELREEAGSPFGRVMDHTTKAGNSSIADIIFRTGKKGAEHYVSPFKDVTIERGILAFLPPDRYNTNIVEVASFYALCGNGKGFFFLNKSLPGENRKFLDDSYAGPAQLVPHEHLRCCINAWSNMGIGCPVRSTVDVEKSFFLHCLLSTVEGLLKAGCHSSINEAECLDASTGEKRFSYMQVHDAHLSSATSTTTACAETGRPEAYEVLALCGCCTCP
jgi:hypothetical protein